MRDLTEFPKSKILGSLVCIFGIHCNNSRLCQLLSCCTSYLIVLWLDQKANTYTIAVTNQAETLAWEVWAAYKNASNQFGAKSHKKSNLGCFLVE